MVRLSIIIIVFFSFCSRSYTQQRNSINIPDQLIMEAYEKAAFQNVLAAVNPDIFFGYFSVCADGIGFGYGNTYPSLDGHQMSDALLWLGCDSIVKANWDYVKRFQKPKGELPIAIIPSEAGKEIGRTNFKASVDPNGGLYKHWVPKDPLRALAGTTYIQNADIIYRYTHDKQWLKEQIASINLTADYLASMINDDGAVGGAGYYVERPTRVEYDGVSQGHAADAFIRLSALNDIAGNTDASKKYLAIAKRIEYYFQNRFWQGTQFAEYLHPEKGFIMGHGLTDTDWTAIATQIATPQQINILWPQLKKNNSFYYDGMPTGIATKPDAYQDWETTYADNQDLAAMGRVWYIEAWARARMNDAEGLTETIRRVAMTGKDSGYYWRERYNANGGYGAKKYNEYPANLIRIVHRFLLGMEHGLDGSLIIAPVAPDEFWKKGFGQKMSWNNRSIDYIIKGNSIKGKYSGSFPQSLSVRLNESSKKSQATINKKKVKTGIENGWVTIELPASVNGRETIFSIEIN